MKIIKRGKTEEELKAILTCGCIFEANKGEYETEEVQIYTYHYCKCPNCGQRANEVKMR